MTLPPATTPRRKVLRAIAIAAAPALVLTGCFSSGSTSSTASDGRVKLAMLLPPRSALSPFSDDAFKLSRWSAAETLVTLNADGDAQPSLATSWTRTGPTTWTFDLRTGVKFQDGTAFDAQSVVTALGAASAASPKPRILDGVNLTVAATDADTVTIGTDKPDPLVPQRMSSPQLSILAPRAYASTPVDPVRNGTGPFTLTSVNGSTSATLDRNENYWGTKAVASGIDVDFVPDGTARAAALRNGDANIVEAVPVSQASVVDPSLLHEVQMPRTNTLYLNNRTGVFADPAMRAAAREAADPQRLVDQVYEGRADVAKGLLGPAIPWSSTRPARTPAPAGNPAGKKITLATFTDRPELPEVATLLQQELEAKGFQVEQVVREYQFIEADALAGKFDAFILSRATVLDSGDPVAYLNSDFSCAGGFNIAQFCDPAVDAQIATASQTDPGDARRAAILQAEKMILDRDAVVPLLHERVLQGESGVSNAARDPRERLLVTPETAVG